MSAIFEKLSSPLSSPRGGSRADPGVHLDEVKQMFKQSFSSLVHTELRPALDEFRLQLLDDIRNEGGGETRLSHRRNSAGERPPTRPYKGSYASVDHLMEVVRPVTGHRISRVSKDSSAVSKRELAFNMNHSDSDGSIEEADVLLRYTVSSERGDYEIDVLPDSRMRLGYRELLHRSVTPWVRTPVFDYVVSSCVILNAVLIGTEIDWRANNLIDAKPAAFVWLDFAFGLFFTVELLLRIYVLGRDFWTSPEWSWNLFDVVVVAMQIFDELSSLLPDGYVPRTSSFVHALRLVRLIRIVRLARVLHLLVELRTMVHSIVGSLRSLFWAVVLYFMLIYTLGVYFTQVVTDQRAHHRAQGAEPTEGLEELTFLCGSLRRTILSLWSCIAGGMDWSKLVNLLITEISPMVGMQLIMFIAFCLLAMANVITGIFVETAMTNAHEDQDIYVARKVVEFFKGVELTADGFVSEETFLEKAKSNQLVELFKAVNVDVEDAPTIFKLIDVDSNGFVDPVELLDGWLRLRGPAKSLDLNMLVRACEEAHGHLRHNQLQLMQMVEQIIESCGMEPAVANKGDKDASKPQRLKSSRPVRRSSVHAMAYMKTHYSRRDRSELSRS
eukprot:TRINITY_DN20021_c2_g4_i2.p1 TRINITY_DN20021_c2_g4~~TRINITY_DN20021_c2_g4_i2.p1  ORF type:complete len:613 (+),score=95.61 TRINITY_DN20021_c2_g4_i2:49-1887(+)